MVTGGGSGIGRACALAFAGEGALVLVVGRRSEPLEATAAGRDTVVSFPAGVGDPEHAPGVVAAAVERWGRLHVERGANGYRRYGEAAVERVRHIRELLASGFTTQDIAVIAPCLGRPPEPGCGPALALYRDKLDEIQDRIDRLQALQVDLRQRLAELEADVEVPAL